MDGQFHAVEFDPSATAAEVLKLVKAKIGLRDGAEGYAIYEVLGQQERSLLADEKVAHEKEVNNLKIDLENLKKNNLDDLVKLKNKMEKEILIVKTKLKNW